MSVQQSDSSSSISSLREQIKLKDHTIGRLQQEINSLSAFQTREKILDSKHWSSLLSSAIETENTLIFQIKEIQERIAHLQDQTADYDTVKNTFQFIFPSQVR